MAITSFNFPDANWADPDPTDGRYYAALRHALVERFAAVRPSGTLDYNISIPIGDPGFHLADVLRFMIQFDSDLHRLMGESVETTQIQFWDLFGTPSELCSSEPCVSDKITVAFAAVAGGEEFFEAFLPGESCGAASKYGPKKLTFKRVMQLVEADGGPAPRYYVPPTDTQPSSATVKEWLNVRRRIFAFLVYPAATALSCSYAGEPTGIFAVGIVRHEVKCAQSSSWYKTSWPLCSWGAICYSDEPCICYEPCGARCRPYAYLAGWDIECCLDHSSSEGGGAWTENALCHWDVYCETAVCDSGTCPFPGYTCADCGYDGWNICGGPTFLGCMDVGQKNNCYSSLCAAFDAGSGLGGYANNVISFGYLCGSGSGEFRELAQAGRWTYDLWISTTYTSAEVYYVTSTTSYDSDCNPTGPATLATTVVTTVPAWTTASTPNVHFTIGDLGCPGASMTLLELVEVGIRAPCVYPKADVIAKLDSLNIFKFV